MNSSTLFLYSNLTLPFTENIFLDYFDMNYNYMGSYSLQSQNLTNYTKGTMMKSDYEGKLLELCAKNSTQYTNNVWG